MKILVPVEDIFFGSAIVNFLLKHKWPEDTDFRVVKVVEPFNLDRSSSSDFAQLLENTDRLLRSH